MPFDIKADNQAFLPSKNRHKSYGVFAMAVLLSACTTSDIDTALAPEPLPAAPQQSTGLLPSTQTVAPQGDPFAETPVVRDPASLDRSGFPNINAVPVGATTQISAAEKARMQSQNQASASRISTITPEETAAYQERLRLLKLLAREHALNTQNEIEGN